MTPAHQGIWEQKQLAITITIPLPKKEPSQQNFIKDIVWVAFQELLQEGKRDHVLN